MLSVVHTFNGPDHDRLLADIRVGLNTIEGVEGFKFASINEQTNTDDILVFSKWEDRSSFENWANTIGENKAFKQATPQMFEVIEEKY
ncbi:antibiotic biosynthesis monooxygenase [Desulfitobacterium metallireducens]|uniref:Antibiotic biosynthesis monooxygenase n=1 Tax=Desulfitobacterium metallireducens DSM 15288 TaxID=871968 RepID=W0EC08_9FIRM|nr:antibiotic biosynthesis monooxygenase [Desulfitobacterium metallireducens]AHF06719.1 antibiotic biosynthesis monooxygenase [Desulfitobacterium metallireducens DSM 15288]